MARRPLARDFALRIANYDGDDCVDWPFAVNAKGYGILRWDGASTIASKVVCELAHGLAPDGTEAAHSCGNRRCCNPNHLRHATSRENKADMLLHGTALRGARNFNAKLNEAAVKEIRQSAESASALGRKFGVSARAVSLVRDRVNWAHL